MATYTPLSSIIAAYQLNSTSDPAATTRGRDFLLNLDCESTPEAIAALRRGYQALLDANVGLEETHEWLDSEDPIFAKAPLLQRDQIQGWKAKVSTYSSEGGWLAAAKAIHAIGEELQRQGVQFGLGGAGSFKRPLFADDM
ncbi:hypothetical protein B0T21DRAFT_453580 [Apiosordaria backusii]|uniref:Uncharacterized protein n=1 Tax=Apiosordaria backusii TaxID=314023 RepID=A0AA40AXY6_9PEZI|nr:hypothetical protein B0T21DRAFT_453580 [Apiosordaria backusii]